MSSKKFQLPYMEAIYFLLLHLHMYAYELYIQFFSIYCFYNKFSKLHILIKFQFHMSASLKCLKWVWKFCCFLHLQYQLWVHSFVSQQNIFHLYQSLKLKTFLSWSMRKFDNLSLKCCANFSSIFFCQDEKFAEKNRFLLQWGKCYVKKMAIFESHETWM